jgi:hypothetical protein
VLLPPKANEDQNSPAAYLSPLRTALIDCNDGYLTGGGLLFQGLAQLPCPRLHLLEQPGGHQQIPFSGPIGQPH